MPTEGDRLEPVSFVNAQHIVASLGSDLEPAAITRAQGQWRLAWVRFRRDRVALASGIVVIVVLLLVFPGPPIIAKIVGHGPNDIFPYSVNGALRPASPLTRVPALHTAPEGFSASSDLPKAPPGTKTTMLLLGSDGPLGRDQLLRLLYGGRVSLEVALGATALALLIGLVLGSVAAYFGGWIDALISRFTDLVMAFPLLLFVIMIGSAFSPKIEYYTLHGLVNQGVLALILLIGAFTWFYPARIVRSQIISLRGREYVEASASLGARDGWIIRKHLLPHLAPPLLVYMTLMVAMNILLEAGITFLGVGIKLPTSSWGQMLASVWGTPLSPQQFSPQSFNPWLTLLPSLAIFVSVLALNQLGEGLREALDPRGHT